MYIIDRFLQAVLSVLSRFNNDAAGEVVFAIGDIINSKEPIASFKSRS